MFQTRAWKLTQPWALPTWTYSSYHIQSESIQYALVHFAVCYKVAKQVFVESKPRRSLFSPNCQDTEGDQMVSFSASPFIASGTWHLDVCSNEQRRNAVLILSNLHLPSAAHCELPKCCLTDKRLQWKNMVSLRALDHNGFRSAWCNLAGTTARPNIHNTRIELSCPTILLVWLCLACTCAHDWLQIIMSFLSCQAPWGLQEVRNGYRPFQCYNLKMPESRFWMSCVLGFKKKCAGGCGWALTRFAKIRMDQTGGGMLVHTFFCGIS